MSDQTIRGRAHDVARDLYGALPFKRHFLSGLRRFWHPPESVYRHLWFKGPFEVNAGARTFYVANDHGLDIETSVFWTGLTGSWERVSIAVWMELCKRAEVILDIGANTGIYSLVAKAVSPTAKVYAVEPIDRIFKRLMLNNQLNGWDITCLPIALTNYDGKGVMYDLPYDHVYAVMLNHNLHTSPAIETVVTVKRAATLIEEQHLQRVDLIKIDVESQEPEVLEGFGDYLHRMKPTLLVEIWNDEIGRRVQEIVKGVGYLFFSIDEVNPPQEQGDIRSPGPGYLNYLICTPPIARGLGFR